MNDTIDGPRCRMSHPALPHSLSIRQGRKPTISECISCDGRDDRKIHLHGAYSHYYCTYCDVSFHDDCYPYPRKTTHPYHLPHPLTLTLRNGSSSSEVDINVTKCTWCGQHLGEEFYHCSVCSFSLDISCAKEDPLPTIPNPKCHHHPLSFLPKPLLVPCHVCGLVDRSEPSYACFQCNFMVHLFCTYFKPRVIKITRHPHRLFYTPSLPPAIIRPCRVCYKTVDHKYGQYSCNNEDCSYTVHTKCAKEVWDGKELEGKPENFHEAKDIDPFRKLGDGLIKHFSHNHDLRLEKYDRVRDATKQCQACVLPIDDSHDFYNCEKCNFCLHEVCAGLPRKLDHALHEHTLVLEHEPMTDYDKMKCATCSRRSTGFRYRCPEVECAKDDDESDEERYHIDVRCILIPEYFTHKSHDHPLCISKIKNYSYREVYCKVCKKKCWDHYLQCTECDFGMCYRCATIPHEIDYKYDKHPLTLCYGENVDTTYTCKKCKKTLDPTEWFYTCNKCCISIHRECLFGASVYMKLGSTFYCGHIIVDVIATVPSSGVTILAWMFPKQVCQHCNNPCLDSVCYSIRFRGRKFWCSLKCLGEAR